MTPAIAPGRLAGRVHRRLKAAVDRTRHRIGLSIAPSVPDAALSPRFRHPVALALQQGREGYQRRLAARSTAEIAEARRLEAKRFTILGHELDYHDGMAWSRDPVSGRDWPKSFSPDIRYRGPDRLGDIKLPWELNKHQYFFTLGKAAWLTGESHFAAEIVRQIADWSNDNPYSHGIHWISALESGARALSWILAYPFVESHCDAVVRLRLLAGVAQHLAFVEQHLSVGPYANTHLVGEAATLVVGGMFVDCRHSDRWTSRGLEILEAEMRRQVTAEGVHAERSVQYHRFFLDHYYLVAAVLAANQQQLSRSVLDAMERMTEFLARVLFADGSAPTFNDGDDARGVWLHADAPADFLGLLSAGAALFGRDDFKQVAPDVSEELFWLFGADGIHRFDRLGVRDARASTAYPEAGYCVLSAAPAGDATLVFDCGPLGHGPSGHGHADALSVQLHAEGYGFIVDPGTFSYNLDYSWRDAFRSTAAHNTVVVDGQDQSVMQDRLSWKSMARTELREWRTSTLFDVADAAHDGYRRLTDPVEHRRTIIFVKPDTWIVTDDLSGQSTHLAEVLFHLRPDCRATVFGDGFRAVLQSPAGRALHLTALPADGPGSPFELRRGSEDERRAWFSPRYGERRPSTLIQRAQRFAGRTRLTTIISTLADVTVRASRVGEAQLFHVDRGSSRDVVGYAAGGGAFAVDGADFRGVALLHRRSAAGADRLSGVGLHQLILPGRLQVRSRVPLDHLQLGDNRCEIAAPRVRREDFEIDAEPALEVWLNDAAISPALP